MRKPRLEREEPGEEIMSLCSFKEYDVGHLFLRASRKFAPALCSRRVLADANSFDHTNVNSIPEYVRKYMSMLYSARQRTFSKAMAKKLSPVYKHVSPVTTYW